MERNVKVTSLYTNLFLVYTGIKRNGIRRYDYGLY